MSCPAALSAGVGLVNANTWVFGALTPHVLAFHTSSFPVALSQGFSLLFIGCSAQVVLLGRGACEVSNPGSPSGCVCAACGRVDVRAFSLYICAAGLWGTPKKVL